jgi:hypothetical protein
MYWPSLKPQVHWQNAQTWKQEVLSCQKMNQHSFYSNKLFSRHCMQPLKCSFREPSLSISTSVKL